MVRIVALLRHGESQWNRENRFTGWADVLLTQRGIQEAQHAARLIQTQQMIFNYAFTSVLTRAIHTLEIVLSLLNQTSLPVEKSWKLNERHYGALQGLSKHATAARYGEEQVKKWRRSFTAIPPPLHIEDNRFPGHDPRYATLPHAVLPTAESLKMTSERVIPYWKEQIQPHVEQRQNVLIVAHGNSLRALIKYLDDLSEDEIVTYDIPTGFPLIYELDGTLRPLRSYYLGDPTTIATQIAGTKAQGKICPPTTL